MAKWLQTNFSFGELSPNLQGYIDLPQYIRGLLTAENFVNLQNGGISFRQGTYYAANTAGNLTGALIPFVFNAGEAYVLEFTNSRLRFYTNNGQLDVAYTITAGSRASGTATLTIGTHCFLVGDSITVAGASPSAYNGTFTVTAKTSTTVSYALSGSGAWTSGGTVTGAYQVVTPYTNPPTSWAQSDDVLYLADGVNPIQVLTRLGSVNWTMADLVTTNGPYNDVNTGTTTFSISGSTLTASAATFASTDVGRHVLILDDSDSYNGSSGMWKWAKITAYTNSTTVTIGTLYYTVASVTTSTTWGGAATKKWALGAWSDTTGYPNSVTLHQQRLVAGGEGADPQRLRGSMSGLYDNFSPFDPDGTVNPDNALSFRIASGRADGIKWLKAKRKLSIGTGSGEYTALSQGPSITPTDINIEQQTEIGSTGGIQPVSTNYSIYMPERGNTNLQEWSYAYYAGGFKGSLMNKLADHIFGGGMTSLAFSQNPLSQIWAARADGQVVVGTDTDEPRDSQGYSTSQYGFTRQVLGGSGVVESLCVIPTSTYDQVWFLVKRTVNGSTVRFVEYLSAPWDGTLANAFFVDAGLSYSGSATTTFTGLGHLEGETVAVMADGVSVGPKTVSGGTVTLTTAASTVHIGLPYTGTCKTVQLNQPDIQGHLQYATRCYLRLLNTYGGSVLTGSDYTTAAPISESASTLYSGSARVLLNQGSQTEQHLKWTQSSPLPMTVLNASIEFNAGMS